jgi:hypothetical protein
MSKVNLSFDKHTQSHIKVNFSNFPLTNILNHMFIHFEDILLKKEIFLQDFT